MINNDQPKTTPRIYIFRILMILVIFGLAIYLLTPQLDTLEHSWDVVESMTWWAVILAAAAQVLSYLSSGYMLHSIVDLNHQKLSIGKGALISVSTLSLSIAAGGGVGLAAMYNWIHQENNDGNTALLAGTLPALLNTVVLIGFAFLGVLYLIVAHVLRERKLIEFGIVLFVLTLLSALQYFALQSPDLVTRLAVWLTQKWAKLRHRPYSPDSTITSVKNFFMAVDSLRGGKWIRPLLGAAASVFFDMLTLYFFFVAAGIFVGRGTLLAGYGISILLGKVAFILPGGVGVVEGSMATLYSSLGISKATSVVAVLGYRFFSFWLPTILGFPIAAYLSGKLFKSSRKKSNNQSQ